MSFETDSPGLTAYNQREAEKKAALPAKLKALSQSLSEAGVAQVVAEYDGSGDSGQIDAIEYSDAESDEITDKVPELLRREVEDFFYAVLDVRYGGWENGDGASGKFEWSVQEALTTDKGIVHEHNLRYTAVHRYSHNGLEG